MNNDIRPHVRPRARAYLIPLVFLLLFGIPSTLALIGGFRGVTEGLTRIVAPVGPDGGGSFFDVEEPGSHVIFYEHRSFALGQPVNTPREFPPLDIRVLQGGFDGTEIPIRPSGGSLTYNLGGRQGYAIASFDAPGAGQYALDARYPPGADGPQVVLAIGEEKVTSTFRLVGGIFGLIATVLTVMISAGIIFIMRYLSKRKLEREATPPAQAPPGAPTA